MLTQKSKVEDVTSKDIENIEYAEISDEKIWRVNLIKEITNKKFNQLDKMDFLKQNVKKFCNMPVCPDGWNSFPPSFISVVFLGLPLSTI